MAAPNSANVSAAKPSAAGAIHAGDPSSVTIPTDATTALTGFVGLGYAAEDGLTNTNESDTDSIQAWGGDTVLTVKTSRTETYTWAFLETNAEVLAEVYGPENVTGDIESGLTVIHNSKDLPRRVYVFETLLSGNRMKRIVVPNGQITEVGDIVHTDGEPIGYEVTLTTFPDESGNTVYEYFATVSGA